MMNVPIETRFIVWMIRSYSVGIDFILQLPLDFKKGKPLQSIDEVIFRKRKQKNTRTKENQLHF